MHYLAIGLRCLVGVVFLISSLSKLGPSSHREFRASLRAMRLLPDRLTAPAAVCVVSGELGLVICLAAPSRLLVVAGFAVAGLLLLVFSGAIAVLLRRGNNRPCRCFGSSATALAPHHVLRNVLLAAAAATGAFASTAARGPLEWAGVLVAVCAGVALGGLVTVLDEIASLFRPGGAVPAPVARDRTVVPVPARERSRSGRSAPSAPLVIPEASDALEGADASDASTPPKCPHIRNGVKR
ncbi:MauE/DoxX family redox-associated membrane protein [Streptomyces sp. NPDC042319]|uniref:MauE/DoxX family redox-associated membrane protein n=1 Tax=Streptomyces sp. NPDC042319 TaxID=3154332 RepID=UPI003403C78D